jgi:preprotein translocase subunit SecF
MKMSKNKEQQKSTNKTTKGGLNDAGAIDFMGKGPIFTVVSLLTIVVSLGVIFSQGFRYGIDFAGGTEVQVQFAAKPPVSEIRSFLETIVGGVMVQTLGEDNEVLIRMQMAEGSNEKEVNEKNNERIKTVTAGLLEQFQLDRESIRRVDTVGPQIGEELKTKGLLAIVYSLIMILIYIGLRFDYKYAPAAVICLFHDAIITLGIFSLLGKEVNIQILAAILTIIGYSLNDTIVNFDRIRENEVIYKGKDLLFIINRSINDVLSRTILTSCTTLMAVIALYIFAGGVIEDLAFTLGIGVVVGTYSSIYVAAPLVVLTDKLSKQWGMA